MSITSPSSLRGHQQTDCFVQLTVNTQRHLVYCDVKQSAQLSVNFCDVFVLCNFFLITSPNCYFLNINRKVIFANCLIHKMLESSRKSLSSVPRAEAMSTNCVFCPKNNQDQKIFSLYNDLKEKRIFWNFVSELTATSGMFLFCAVFCFIQPLFSFQLIHQVFLQLTD